MPFLKQIRKDSTGKIVEIVCNCEKSETAPKPKAFIHWVSHPINVTVRLYEMLYVLNFNILLYKWNFFEGSNM